MIFDHDVALPDSIDPCPIVDAVFEVRFDPIVPPLAVTGMIFQKLITAFPTVKQLPVLPIALPEDVRRAHPALTNQPQFRLERDDFVALVGENLFAIGVLGLYQGWSITSRAFKEAISSFLEANVVKTVQRFGLKYVNYFPRNILPDLTLDFLVRGEPIRGNSMVFRANVPASDCRMQVQFFSDLKVASQDGRLPLDPNVLGSILDLDCYAEFPQVAGRIQKAAEAFLERAHDEEKKMFFRLLKDEFVRTLNPKYPNDSTSNGS